MKVKVFHGLKLIQNNVLNAPLILKKIKDVKLWNVESVMLSFAGFVSKNVKIISVNVSLMNKCKMIKTIF